MSFVLDDTIAAIATASAPAWRGIVRLSGPRVADCVLSVFVPHDDAGAWIHSPGAIVATGGLRLEGWQSEAPCELYYWPDRRSYTREPVIELHTIGSPPFLEAVLSAICRGGARLARPGEFTFRAFLAGRLDLTQAEAVLGVIDAADRRQLDAALAQLAGGLSEPLSCLRDRLLDVLAHLEAGLDFADEDLEFISRTELAAHLADARQHVEAVLRQIANRGDCAATFRVVLVGWPNVGKSSLFNALANGPAAIVSPIAGTTRDYLTATLDLGDIKCELIDTAGVEPRTSNNSVATEAQAMTARGREQSDLQVLCLDSTRAPNEWETAELSAATLARIVVLTKCEAPQRHKPDAQARDRAAASSSLACASGLHDVIRTSSHAGFGLEDLRAAIRSHIEAALTSDAYAASTAVRCRDGLARADNALARAEKLIHDRTGEELIAAEIRLSLDELAQIVGAVYTEDLLDRIFSRFCIGK
jgi:tRNA modification GTPase